MRAEDVPQAWAIMAGAEVLANLFDRRGIKQALWEIDEDTLNELRETIGRLAIAAVAPLIGAAALPEPPASAEDGE